MTELAKRFVTASVLIPMVLLGIFWGGLPFLLLVLAAIALGEGEFFRLMEAKGVVPLRRVGILCGISLGISVYFRGDSIVATGFTAVILLLMISQLRRRSVEGAIATISTTLLGVLYVAWLLSHAILLRNSENGLGIFYLVLVLAATYLGDTGAYFVGRQWGRHKLLPLISPKKSWEGLVGGIFASVVAVFIVRWIFRSDMGTISCGILGVLLSVGGLLGDLAESLFKREAQVKDSGGLFPGHGGLLDRVDSLLFTLPIAYYYIKLCL
ncbi:MAG: phosphatidate cytidylyltransferase [Deltaproteobacteria bacterium]|nr:phosphatidate cytidylyltransferase [Deltaproteobacteria bacterium]